MLDLPDLTLVAVYTVAHELTEMAVAECTRHVRFGDVKLFTNRPLRSQVDAIQIEPFANPMQAGTFMTYEVPRHIKTSHALFIQWDSWIVDPLMWRPQFLDCDYIGAPWWYRDGLNVGNSGFCIRSKALIEFLAAHPDEFPLASPEDEVLCRVYRPRLPQFKWADEVLAHEFSFERSRAGLGARSFGFHGMFNWPFVLTDAQIEARILRATGYVLKSQHCGEMRALLAARQSGRAA
ncbi:MAG: DUF5672 family protein [Xanthobacteraceae bacterium]